MINHKGTDEMAVDYDARSMAQHVQDQLSAHEKFCEERVRRAEIFETEMKRDSARILRRMDEAVREHIKMQTRQSIMWAVMTFGLVFGVEYFMR